MAKKKTYEQYLRAELGDLVEQLQLPPLYKQSLKQRWIDQVVWADKKAGHSRKWHYRLRLTTIIGGVILPALVGLNMQLRDNLPRWFPYIPFFMSQVIAVSAALEEFHRYGDRWRDYRKMAEELKGEGWQYLQLTGSYESLLNHMEGYATFANRVESVIKNDVKNYVAALQQQQIKENEQIKEIIKSANAVAEDEKLFARPKPPPPPPQPQIAAPVAPMARAALPGSGAAGTLRVRQDTDFTLAPQPAQSLPDNYKIRIGNGNAFGLQSSVNAGNNFLQVTLDRGIGPENRNVWFVWAFHVEILPGNGYPTANTMNPNAMAPVMGAAPNGFQTSNMGMAPPTATAPAMGAAPTGFQTSSMGMAPPAAPAAPAPNPAPAPVPASNGEIKLPVPYFSQRDNEIDPYRTCNTSSCAMAAKYLGANISGDDDYYQQYVVKYGDTTDHGVQTQALADLGIKSTWNTSLGLEDLDESLASGLPIVVGILHHGPLEAPSGGGHMIVVIGRTTSGDYIVNDPYGNLLDGYATEEGGGLTYPRDVMEARWTVDGPKTGWGRLFYDNPIPGGAAPTAPAQTASVQTAPPQMTSAAMGAAPMSAPGGAATGQYITAEQLIQIAPNADANRLRELTPGFNETLARFQINTPLRICHFIAQVAHESDCFNAMEEYASGEDYEGRSDLGNTQPGDGVRFKGRGLMQLTGRANYEEFSKAMNLDFVSQPELLAQAPYAVMVAGWYWDSRKLNGDADKDSLEDVTYYVNGGYNGLEDRRRYLQAAKAVLGV
ncbi:MAG: DUF4231 domain-containing protein [Cyanobacteriota bacterium]|nr:DUF4231 domain-containing protein [Cyanobacteriota bacterium]